MSMKLDTLVTQLDQMGAELAGRQQEQQSAIGQARRWLHQHAEDFAELAQMAGDYYVPAPHEALDRTHPAPPAPARFTIIGSDGSTVPPDRHSAALYYLINVGGLIFRKGSGEAPFPFQTSHLAYAQSELYEGARLVEGNLLDVRRDQAELQALVTCAENECEADGETPLVTLADGTLLLWVLEESSAANRQARIDAYLDVLDHLAALRIPIAGYVSRPRYRAVLRLVWMAHLRQAGKLGAALPPEDPFVGLSDRHLFATLPAGARTALFVSPSSINAFYHARKHRVSFFYLNVSATNEPEIARLEVPEWVAGNEDLLGLVHAAVLDQCHVTGGYPYVLARAHEQALVTTAERRHLEQLVIGALQRHGLARQSSPKAWLKELTGSPRRRHHL